VARCKKHRKAAAKSDILQAMLWAAAYFRRPLTDPSIRSLTLDQILLHDDMRVKLERIKAGLPPDSNDGDVVVDESFDVMCNPPSITAASAPEPIDLSDSDKWRDVP
jgi:hypothetical protein